jgi:hypothetical protein
LLLLGGRVVWADSDDPALALSAALDRLGLLEAQAATEARDEDELVERQAEGDPLRRAQLDGLRRELLRARVRAALRAPSAGVRFLESSARVEGIDPALLPDIDLNGIIASGSEAPIAPPEPPTAVAEWDEGNSVTRPIVPNPVIFGETRRWLEQAWGRKEQDSWYDLLGLRPGASKATVQRCAEDWEKRLRQLSADPALPQAECQRAGRLADVVALAARRLADPAMADSYDQAVRSGKFRTVAELMAELEQPQTPPASASAAGSSGGWFSWLRGGR